MKDTWAPLVMLKYKEKGRGQNGERTRELAALFFSRSGSAETLVSPRGFFEGLTYSREVAEGHGKLLEKL